MKQPRNYGLSYSHTHGRDISVCFHSIDDFFSKGFTKGLEKGRLGGGGRGNRGDGDDGDDGRDGRARAGQRRYLKGEILSRSRTARPPPPPPNRQFVFPVVRARTSPPRTRQGTRNASRR